MLGKAASTKFELCAFLCFSFISSDFLAKGCALIE